MAGKNNKNQKNKSAAQPIVTQAAQKRKANVQKKKTFLGRCQKLLNSMLELEDSKPFRTAVDKTKYPDYHARIRYDINLSKISTKLKTGLYGDPSQFGDDVQLLVKNWNDYIKDRSLPIFGQITRLSWWFEGEYKKIIEAWKSHQTKKRRIDPETDSAGAASSVSSQNTGGVPPLMSLPTSGAATHSIPTPPHLTHQNRFPITNSTSTIASLISSIRAGTVPSVSKTITNSSNTSDSPTEDLDLDSASEASCETSTGTNQANQATTSLAGSTNKTFAPNLNSGRWLHKKTVTPNVRALANRRETYPGPHIQPNPPSSPAGGRTPASPSPQIGNKSPLALPRRVAPGPTRQSLPTVTENAPDPGNKTAVLEVVVGAAAIWFGDFRRNPPKDVRFTENGIDFYLPHKNKVEEFHLGVNDLVRICGHLGPVKSLRKSFFFFITPVATKRLKAWLRTFTQTSVESCSLIILASRNVTTDQCSKLMYIFWLYGRESMFGPIFSEINKSRTLLSNVRPDLAAEVDKEAVQSLDEASPPIVLPSVTPAVTGNSAAPATNSLRQGPRPLQHVSTFRSSCTTVTATPRVSIGGQRLHAPQVNNPVANKNPPNPNQPKAKRLPPALSSVISPRKGPANNAARQKANPANMTRAAPNRSQEAASSSRLKPPQTEQFNGRDDFAARLENHIRTRLDSSSDSESQRHQAPVPPPQTDPATNEANRPNPQNGTQNVIPQEMPTDNSRQLGPRQLPPGGQSPWCTDVRSVPFVGIRLYKPSRTAGKIRPNPDQLSSPPQGVGEQQENNNLAHVVPQGAPNFYTNPPWHRARPPGANNVDFTADPDFEQDDTSMDRGTFGQNDQPRFPFRFQNRDRAEARSYFPGHGKNNKRKRRLWVRNKERMRNPMGCGLGGYGNTDQYSNYDDSVPYYYRGLSIYDNQAPGPYRNQGSESYHSNGPRPWNGEEWDGWPSPVPGQNEDSGQDNNDSLPEGDGGGSEQNSDQISDLPSEISTEPQSVNSDIHRGDSPTPTQVSGGGDQNYSPLPDISTQTDATSTGGTNTVTDPGEVQDETGHQESEDEDMENFGSLVIDTEDDCVVQDTPLLALHPLHPPSPDILTHQLNIEVEPSDSRVESNPSPSETFLSPSSAFPSTSSAFPTSSAAPVDLLAPPSSQVSPVPLRESNMLDGPALITATLAATSAKEQQQASNTSLADDDLEIIIPSDSEDELTFVPMSGSAAKNADEEAEDLVMTATKVSTKCPITQQTMLRPVRNKHCGHCYDQDGIHQLIINRKGKARCPVPGCSNANSLLMLDMEFNLELFNFIRTHTSDAKTLEELAKVAVDLKLD